MRLATILGAPLAAQSYEEAIDTFLNAARQDAALRAHFCTVHSIVEATKNPQLREAFASADRACMDGVPLVWLARRRGFREAERVCGPDVMLTICDRGREMGLRHFFLGGAAGTPERLAQRLVERFPGMTVVGTASPPFRALSPSEDLELVAEINATRPHVLWIGLGSPKQDLWAADHEDRLQVKLLMPVGAAFDYHSGGLRRAPRWMRPVGLEWLFRLAMEPGRLWRRYLTTNVHFLWLVLREEVARRRQPPRS
jgi:N-acetylglucosaminyldiphosphoundecaprenol N-acetyl-beta-D-mannosaminyltransferase